MVEIIAVFALNALFTAAILFLITAGLNLIYGVMRIVNLAHGSLFALGAYIGAWFVLRLSGHPAPLLYFGGDFLAPLPFFVAEIPTPLLYLLPLLAAGAVALAGLGIEPSLLRPIYRRAEEYQLLLTFGVLLIIEDALFAVWGPFPLLPKDPVEFLGSTIILGFQYPVYNFLVIAVGFAAALFLWLLVYRTRFGVLLRAVALDRDMAQALGVNVKRLYTLAFALGLLFAGLAGALWAPPTAASLGMGVDVLVVAFVVMVVGGLGSLKGAFVAALLVGALRSVALGFGGLAGLTVIAEVELALLYLIAAGVLLVRPQGLFGQR